ncbi:MAG: aminotransferase class I/II-fold pyridoxal phosphate-dependent enzyme [Chloroflexota bacterium]|nr:aminotransferase class I/II-fold pyridoxal phosphate-dependent enzyme [Chloroflexota bacterium]
MKIERFALERWMTKWELNVDCDIAESGIAPFTIAQLAELCRDTDRDTLLAELSAIPLGYSEARGTLALRQAIAETYQSVDPDDVLVTTGAIEANFLLFHALLEPGDHVISVAPAYQQLLSVPRSIGCDVTPWQLHPDQGFRFDLDELEQLLRPNTRMIVINSPHNPTGALLGEEDLRRITRLAEERGSYILSDEVYRGLDHPAGPPQPPSMRDLTPRGIGVGSLSKAYGLPGLRIGWIAANPNIVNRCWGLRDYVSLSPGALNDRLARLAIANRDLVFARSQVIIGANMVRARVWFRANQDIMSWNEPRAGLLAMVKYSADVPSETLADDLAREMRVMLAPGAAFGLEGYLRLGIGQRPEIFLEGLRRTSTYLRRLSGTAASESEH